MEKWTYPYQKQIKPSQDASLFPGFNNGTLVGEGEMCSFTLSSKFSKVITLPFEEKHRGMSFSEKNL